MTLDEVKIGKWTFFRVPKTIIPETFTADMQRSMVNRNVASTHPDHKKIQKYAKENPDIFLFKMLNEEADRKLIKGVSKGIPMLAIFHSSMNSRVTERLLSLCEYWNIKPGKYGLTLDSAVQALYAERARPYNWQIAPQTAKKFVALLEKFNFKSDAEKFPLLWRKYLGLEIPEIYSVKLSLDTFWFIKKSDVQENTKELFEQWYDYYFKDSKYVNSEEVRKAVENSTGNKADFYYILTSPARGESELGRQFYLKAMEGSPLLTFLARKRSYRFLKKMSAVTEISQKEFSMGEIFWKAVDLHDAMKSISYLTDKDVFTAREIEKIHKICKKYSVPTKKLEELE